MIPRQRVRSLNDAPVRPRGDYVLYWMIASRRTRWSFSLERAVELARELGRPLLVLEGLRCGYRWASARFHHFVLQGMTDNQARLEKAGISYYPYVEPSPGAGRGLLEALAKRACAVVTDDYPAFFLPRMVRAAAGRLPVRLEAVDSNGIVPLRAADRTFVTAHSFRRFVQKTLLDQIGDSPVPDPLAGDRLPALKGLPSRIAARWKPTRPESAALERLPIDRDVAPVEIRGGAVAGRRLLRNFVSHLLPAYCERRSGPDLQATSGLSPHLHFGHVAAHDVLFTVLRSETWDPGCLAERPTGARQGWWGVGPEAEAFLDQLVTWREVGFNMAATCATYDRYDSLPAWALTTLSEHAADRRAFVYTPEEFERGRTHDTLWNAAQNQLVREGRMHNYLRMLWGKKILEWSPAPEKALEVMIELNNKYALDGRDPNSYSGIFWCLGRYDRAWGPERPVFGKVRYMSSENTLRKLGGAARAYRERYTAPPPSGGA